MFSISFLMLLMLMVMVVEPVSLIEGDAHVRLDLWHRLSQYQARLVIVSPEKNMVVVFFYHIYQDFLSHQSYALVIFILLQKTFFSLAKSRLILGSNSW